MQEISVIITRKSESTSIFNCMSYLHVHVHGLLGFYSTKCVIINYNLLVKHCDLTITK